jgi:hypothetical protein
VPDYPDEIKAAGYAAWQEAWVTRNHSNPLFAEHVVRDVLNAAAPLFANAVAERIAAFAETREPLGDHVPTARRRALMTAVQVAAGAFSTRDEDLRQVAEAIGRGDFTCCDAEATMARLMDAEGEQQ